MTNHNDNQNVFSEARHDGFLFIGDAIEISDECLPYDLGFNFTLDKATESEINQWLRPWATSVLAHFDHKSQSNAGRQRYEGRWVNSTEHEGHELSWLTSDKWRYYVIRHSHRISSIDGQTELTAIQQVARLIDPELAPVLYITFAGYLETTTGDQVPGKSEVSRRLFNQPKFHALPLEIPNLEEKTLKRLADLFSKRLNLRDEHKSIIRALEILEQSDDLQHNSAMWLLSQFVALEALLTHAPSPGDPADSIGRQLRRSVPLLLRRSGELNLLESLDIAVPLDTALKKLYELRSRIAHGETEWPETGSSLSALVNLEKATEAIKLILKATLRQALSEPDLVCDLKGR